MILPQVAAKPDPENGGSCNSGDEGIDTTEPVDDIEGTETSNEPVGDVSESAPYVPDEKIEGNDIQDEKQQDQEKQGVIEDDTVQEEVKEEDESPKEQEETFFEEQESEKKPRDILLEKRCSLTHTAGIDRVLDKEAAKVTKVVNGEVHEFQKVKSELKAVDDQVAGLSVSQESGAVETDQTEKHTLQTDVIQNGPEEVSAVAVEDEEQVVEEEEEEVGETVIELTLAPGPMIMELTPAPVEISTQPKPVAKKGGAKRGSKQSKEVLTKNKKNGKSKEEEGEVKKKSDENGQEAVVANGKARKSGGSPTRKVGKENKGDVKAAKATQSSKSRIRERTLERDEMLGTKKGESAQKKASVGSNKDPQEVVVVEGGLMRPTKAWLNHLGDQQTQAHPPRSPSPRRRPSRASTQQGSKPPLPGADGEAGLARRSSSARGKTSKPDNGRASSANSTKSTAEASIENGTKVVSRAIRAKSPKKKTNPNPPPVPPKPSTGTEEGVVEETLSAGEAIIKFETESANFAAVNGHETLANGSKEESMKANNVSDIKSKKKSEVIQADNQDKSKEQATLENSAGDKL